MRSKKVNVKDDLISAFDEFIEGKFVSRQVVNLTGDGMERVYDGLADLFIARLKLHGYVEIRVGEIELKEDERVPAFVLKSEKAYFGWVFVERFTDRKSRRLFGSVVRNKKGDWLIQVAGNSTERIYANINFKIEMEAERLFLME